MRVPATLALLTFLSGPFGCGSSTSGTELREEDRVAESVVGLDVWVLRVNASSNLRQARAVERDLRFFMQSEAADVIAACYQAAVDAGLTVGPQSADPVLAELDLRGTCRVGRCFVSAEMHRSADRVLGDCMADGMEELLSGRPETRGDTTFLIPLRIRLTPDESVAP